LTKKLTVTAHRFSATAKEKIEAAGGTVNALREPVEKKQRRRKAAPAAAEPEPEAVEETPAEGEEE
jgi:large subunit ribosomal protein L15